MDGIAFLLIKEGNVYGVDKNASARPSQYVVKALKEMARAVYQMNINKDKKNKTMMILIIRCSISSNMYWNFQ